MPGAAGAPGPPTPVSSSGWLGGMAPTAVPRPQPDNVGILAAEVYFPSTFVSGREQWQVW
jgi:hypothetical protein